MEINIHFFKTNQFIYKKTAFEEILKWLIKNLNLPVRSLDLILTNSEYLRKLHKKHFDLDSETDVITFNLSDSKDLIEGEIYISCDMAKIQSKKYKVTVLNEICRLMAHGCLHLAGYDDSTQSKQKDMKKIENKLVKKIDKIFYKNLYV